MKKTVITAYIITIALQVFCKPVPDSIPLGEWRYRLLINDNEIGEAVFINRIDNDNYVNVTRMEMKVGSVTNKTEQVLTETRDFDPVKYEMYNSIISGESVQNIKTIANFKGQSVEVDTGLSKSVVSFNVPVKLDGNFFISELIKHKFKNGTAIKSLIYEPTIEIDEPVPVVVRVVGRENVKINDKVVELIHIVETIENFKSLDIYMNEKGITQKVVIRMLNNRIELILK